MRRISTIVRGCDWQECGEGTSNSDFIFSEAGGQTNVIWTMTGKQSFVGKAICLFMSMEQMLGPDFERGLAQLKQVAEGK